MHISAWGLALVRSNVGALYLVMFINDCTRKVWVSFLKHKSEVFDKFKAWKGQAESENDAMSRPFFLITMVSTTLTIQVFFLEK